jgi:hypothetical protein
MHDNRYASTDATQKTSAVTPDTVVKVRLGVLAGIVVPCVIAIATGAVWLWEAKTNGEQALVEIRELRCAVEPIRRDLDRLKWMHQTPSPPISRAVPPRQFSDDEAP